MKNPTYTKEIGDETEGFISKCKTMRQISGVLAIFYGHLAQCLNSGDKDSTRRIYDIILKGTERLKILAKERNIEPWDGN